MTPSIQIVPTLGSKVYKWYLLRAIWSPRDNEGSISGPFIHQSQDPFAGLAQSKTASWGFSAASCTLGFRGF